MRVRPGSVVTVRDCAYCHIQPIAGIFDGLRVAGAAEAGLEMYDMNRRLPIFDPRAVDQALQSSDDVAVIGLPVHETRVIKLVSLGVTPNPDRRRGARLPIGTCVQIVVADERLCGER